MQSGAEHHHHHQLHPHRLHPAHHLHLQHQDTQVHATTDMARSQGLLVDIPVMRTAIVDIATPSPVACQRTSALACAMLPTMQSGVAPLLHHHHLRPPLHLLLPQLSGQLLATSCSETEKMSFCTESAPHAQSIWHEALA